MRPGNAIVGLIGSRVLPVLLGVLLLASLSVVVASRVTGTSAQLFSTAGTSMTIGVGHWTATVTIVKEVAQPAPAQSFGFETSFGSACVETIPAALGHGGSFTCTFDAGGNESYTVTETGPLPEGWALADIVCNSANGITIASPSVTFSLAPSQSVTCTYYNTYTPALGELRVVKLVEGGDASPGDWQLSVYDDQSQVAAGPDAGSSTGTTYQLEAGAYTVTETGLAGYTAMFSGACDSNGAVTVVAGVTVTCTVTNTRDTGTVVIAKQADEDGTFSFNLPSPLNSLCSGASITGAPFTPITCSNVPTGNYAVTEQSQAGWSLSSVGCIETNAGPNESDGAGLAANIRLDKGETVNCTFVNTYDAPDPDPPAIPAQCGGRSYDQVVDLDVIGSPYAPSGAADLVVVGTGDFHNVDLRAMTGDHCVVVSGSGNVISTGGGDDIIWTGGGGNNISTGGGDDIIYIGTAGPWGGGSNNVDCGNGDDTLTMVAGGGLANSCEDAVAL